MSALAHTANKCSVPAQRWQQIVCSDENKVKAMGVWTQRRESVISYSCQEVSDWRMRCNICDKSAHSLFVLAFTGQLGALCWSQNKSR